MRAEGGELGILQQVAFHVAENTRNVSQEFGIVFDPVDVDEPAGRLEIALNAREVEQTAERVSIGPKLPAFLEFAAGCPRTDVLCICRIIRDPYVCATSSPTSSRASLNLFFDPT